MHNDFGSKQPVESHEPNAIPCSNAYNFISIDIIQNLRGVYKQWTGLLEWWNSGMVD